MCGKKRHQGRLNTQIKMVPHYKEIVYWDAAGGLCNKIRALIAYQSLAEVWKVPLSICWEPNWACPEEITNLFDTSSMALISKKQAAQIYREKRKDRLIVGLEREDRQPDSVTWKRFASDAITEEEFSKLADKHLSSLTPLPYLKEKIEGLANQLKVKETIGVHLRFTDYAVNIPLVVKYHSYPPTIRHYQKVMNDYIKQDRSVRFFLASDNPASEMQMRKKYGERVISYRKKYLLVKGMPAEKYRHTSEQDALIDLYLLSKTQKVLAAPLSSFGKMAARIGRIELIEVQRSKLFPPKIMLALFKIEAKCKNRWRRIFCQYQP